MEGEGATFWAGAYALELRQQEFYSLHLHCSSRLCVDVASKACA